MQLPHGLPRWLFVGLAFGALFSAVAAVAFLAGARLFPSPETERRTGVTTDERRREEVRGYLRYIGESFAEDHPVAGHTVAFYLPERDVAITFDARAYFGLEGTDVYPVLVEHELPGAALGPRLPFETPERDVHSPVGEPRNGFAGGDGVPGDRFGGAVGEAGEPGEGVAAAFETLGLPTTAGPDDVRDAYRDRLKRVHPDQGGDPEAFRRLREAYTVAREAAS